jgi:hypothetical protein
MSNIESGVRIINGVNVVALDGLWDAVSATPIEKKMSAALAYAGSEFHDDEQLYVSKGSIALVGIGGQPLAHLTDSDTAIAERIAQYVNGSREMMGTSAAFSYLNSGERSQGELFESVIKLGHFSIAHTASVNILLAGLTEAAELELNLQRDIVHISKVTNARTAVQTHPPIVVSNPHHLELARSIREVTAELTQVARNANDPDELEVLNSFYPINKATILMMSGDLSNIRKFAQIRDDTGKEKELRDIADSVNTQLGTLWPEIFTRKGSHTMESNLPQGDALNMDYFAKELLAKLPSSDPIHAAYEAQAVSRTVGFDFADFEDVVPRALDEVRETKEAYLEEGAEGREHFGDEIADIMFSLINLARHAGIKDLPPYAFFEEQLANITPGAQTVEEVVDGIARQINDLAELAHTNPEGLEPAMADAFNDGMLSAVTLAKKEGFVARDLLIENVRKYLIRCEAIEQLASEDNKSWKDLSAAGEIITYWKKAKALLQ